MQIKILKIIKENKIPHPKLKIKHCPQCLGCGKKKELTLADREEDEGNVPRARANPTCSRCGHT